MIEKMDNETVFEQHFKILETSETLKLDYRQVQIAYEMEKRIFPILSNWSKKKFFHIFPVCEDWVRIPKEI